MADDYEEELRFDLPDVSQYTEELTADGSDLIKIEFDAPNKKVSLVLDLEGVSVGVYMKELTMTDRFGVTRQ